MWNKRGINQIDWVISLSIFILYISWFFLLIRPYYFPIEEDPQIELLEDAFVDDIIWTIYKTPLVVFSDIHTTYEPVAIDFSLGITEGNFAFSDNRYFTIFEDELYFLADLKKGSNLFWLVNSDAEYNKSNIQTDLFATNYSASVSSMRATYHDGLLKKAYYKGDLVIDDLTLMRHDLLVDVDNSSFFSSKIMAVHSADTTGGFSHSSTVFGYNTRIYNKIKLDQFIDRRNVDLTMKLKGYPKYYADNVNFGNILSGECASFNAENLFFYNDDDFMLFAFENETEIDFCYSAEDEIELNITIRVERESEYQIYFEPFAIIPNGNFDDHWKGWSFVNNTDQYRACTSREGTAVLISNSSDPFLAGDWENSSASGLPIAGFGSNKSSLDGTGGKYDGMLISSPFEVPDYADFIHVWRHFDINNFDHHNDEGILRPDAVYIELRNADTGDVVLLLDSWEASVTPDNFSTIGENFVNISRFKSMNLQLSLNVIGHENEVIDQCQDGNDDDALVQIDDIYFTDADHNKIKPSFDYANIMSRIHARNYESYF